MRLLLLVAVVFGIGLGAAAWASETTSSRISPQLAADEITFIYFSNAELTGEPVGEVNYDCWRTKTQWGSTSPYHAQLSASCSGGTGTELSCPGMPQMVCPGYVFTCLYLGDCGQYD